MLKECRGSFGLSPEDEDHEGEVLVIGEMKGIIRKEVGASLYKNGTSSYGNDLATDLKLIQH